MANLTSTEIRFPLATKGALDLAIEAPDYLGPLLVDFLDRQVFSLQLWFTFCIDYSSN